MSYAVYTMSFRGGPVDLKSQNLTGKSVICAVNDTMVGNCKAACVVNETTGKVVARYELEYDSAKGFWVRVHKGGKRF